MGIFDKIYYFAGEMKVIDKGNTEVIDGIISRKNLISIIIQTIVLIILLGIPAILTKLPEKSGKIESVK